MQEVSGSIPLVSTNHFHTNSRSSAIAQIAPIFVLLAGLSGLFAISVEAPQAVYQRAFHQQCSLCKQNPVFHRCAETPKLIDFDRLQHSTKS
jgi:hypothetical protein